MKKTEITSIIGLQKWWDLYYVHFLFKYIFKKLVRVVLLILREEIHSLQIMRIVFFSKLLKQTKGKKGPFDLPQQTLVHLNQ